MMVLQAVYDAFNREGNWPVLDYVDRVVLRDHDLDAHFILQSSDPNLVAVDRAHLRGDQPVRLTIEGVARCDGSDRDVELFVRSLRYLAEREIAVTPTSPSAAASVRVTSAELGGDFNDICMRTDDLALARLWCLLDVERIGEGGSWDIEGHRGRWELNLGRDVRRYRNVVTLDDYRAKRREQLHWPALIAPAELSVPASDEPGDESVGSEDSGQAAWNDDFSAAMLLNESSDLAGWLAVSHWWEPDDREGEPCWVASYLDPASDEPIQLQVLVERPARAADTPTRRGRLLEQAKAAIAAGPSAVGVSGAPSADPVTAQEWRERLELLISAWQEASESAAGAISGSEYERFTTLSQALNFAYMTDQALGVIWGRLKKSPATAERLSRSADALAESAIEHNRAMADEHELPWSCEDDPALDAYRDRQSDGKVYAHWSSLLVAGSFHEKFFIGLRWARGRLTHQGSLPPLELRQSRPGAQHRWKWLEPERLQPAGDTRDRKAREAYGSALAGNDVLGQLNHLTEVFYDARRLLTAALEEASTTQKPRP